MRRRILALACVISAATAAAAQAQSYPTYAGAMPQGGMYSPGLPPAAMYGPMPQGMYPGMSQQGGMNPGLVPQRTAYPDAMGPGAYAAQANYQVPAAPPPMKLPRGVTSENGLLYYNGNPYADNSYPQYNPYRTVAYEAGAESAMGPGGMQSVMAQGGTYGGEMSGYGQMPGSDCGCEQGCDDGDGNRGCCNLFHHGNPFPGKYGYMWTGGVEALAFNRDAGSDRVLVRNTDTLAPVFNSNDFSFDFTSGARAHINLMGPSGIQYQAVYMKLATLIADADVNGDNNLQIPFPLAGFTVDFFGADEMLFHYTSQIQGGEVNVIYPFGNFQLLAGYRYLEIDEGLRLTSIDVVDAGTSDFSVNAFNQMHGGQIGILGQWELFGLINFDFDAKFGILGDIVHTRQTINDFNNSVVLFQGAGHESSVAYVTEIGLVGVVPLGPSFNVRCGYNAFFIDRVALAPDQFDFLENPTVPFGSQVNQKGDIIVQGVVLGIDARW